MKQFDALYIVFFRKSTIRWWNSNGFLMDLGEKITNTDQILYHLQKFNSFKNINEMIQYFQKENNYDNMGMNYYVDIKEHGLIHPRVIDAYLNQSWKRFFRLAKLYEGKK